MSADGQTSLEVEVVDAEPAPVLIPHPRTGEAIAVLRETPTETLAELRDAIVEHEQAVLKAWKDAVDRELVDRLDYEGRRSIDVAGWKVSVGAPTKVVWDGDAANKALTKLVRAGLISKARAQECVERVITYKPKHGPLTQLAKHADERVRDAIEACRTDEDVPTRRATVTRKIG